MPKYIDRMHLMAMFTSTVVIREQVFTIRTNIWSVWTEIFDTVAPIRYHSNSVKFFSSEKRQFPFESFLFQKYLGYSL